MSIRDTHSIPGDYNLDIPHRARRLRRLRSSRQLIAENHLTVDSLVYPIFVEPGTDSERPIDAMPDQCLLSPDRAAAIAKEAATLGIPAVLLFGRPRYKDELGSDAHASDGALQEAIRRIKDTTPELTVITDVCLCAYTNHGHCGILAGDEVNNDLTVRALTEVARSHAAAGSDIVAPSDMMDGRVKAIRQSLDEAHYSDIAIMSYSAKFASAFYGPFRNAADSTPAFGDRQSYQMDHRNTREALREIEGDILEGADIVMIKPALPYLDIISAARQQFKVPLAGYNVSGTYAMVKAAAQHGWLDEQQVATEILTAISRSGADMIITYFALQLGRWQS